MCLTFSNKRAKPLALYVFSQNGDTQREIIDNTRSGAALANDMLIHFSNSHLPFGGTLECLLLYNYMLTL